MTQWDTLSLALDGSARGPWRDEVEMLVNGVDLFDLLDLRRGDWLRPPTTVLCPPSDHLFGGPDRWEDPSDSWFEGNQVAIAACTCGQPGCSAVLMEVEVMDHVITWSRFRLSSGIELIARSFNFNPRQYRSAVGASLRRRVARPKLPMFCAACRRWPGAPASGTLGG